MAKPVARPSLFVVLTEDEADGVLVDPHGVAGSRGLAKIRRALEGARLKPSREPVANVPALRAHDYQPSTPKPTQPRSVAVDPPVQPHARPGPRERRTSSSSYVPWRDEQDGLYA